MTADPRRSPAAPGLVIGAHVEIGERVSFGANVIIHDNVVIGDDCIVEDGAVLGKSPRLGRHSRAPAASPARLVIESGATICSYAIVCRGGRVGADSVIGDHVFLREHAEIGTETVIGHGAAIGRGVRVGSRVRLQNSVIVAPESLIEDDVFFGPLVAITNDQTLGRREATGARLQGAVARRGCRVGANAVLLPGVEIGVEAIVAAGSVVTRSVPDRTVAMGAPARVTRPVDPRELLPGPPGPG